jgi:hypothetical protein
MIWDIHYVDIFEMAHGLWTMFTRDYPSRFTSAASSILADLTLLTGKSTYSQPWRSQPLGSKNVSKRSNQYLRSYDPSTSPSSSQKPTKLLDEQLWSSHRHLSQPDMTLRRTWRCVQYKCTVSSNPHPSIQPNPLRVSLPDYHTLVRDGRGVGVEMCSFR